MKKILSAVLASIIIYFLLFLSVHAATILYPSGGGTGTNVIPTQGYVLVGQANGLYLPQATSTLGITGGGGGAVSSVFGRTGAVVATAGDYTTALVTEVTNLYFTAARVLATTLSGFVSGAGTITSSDTVLSAIQKLDGNIAGKQPAGTYITALTGDGTATGPGSTALTLATVNGNVGTFNSLTVNGKGLVTAATSISYENPLSFISPLTRSTNTISIPLASSSVAGFLSTSTFAIFNNKQNALTLTTTGTTGPSTLIGATLNIPQYSASGGGAGNVVGPTGSANNGIATYSGTSGLIIQDSGSTLDTSGNLTLGGGTGQLFANNATFYSGLVSGSDINVTGSGIFSVNLSALNGSVNTAGLNLSIPGSPTVLIQPSASTAAWNLTLPLSAGSSGQFLQTNGSGVTTWATVSGTGTVTNVATNATLTGGPITTTGTLGINLANANTWTAAQTIQSSSASAFAVGLNGATNPGFVVDVSTASQVSGLLLKANGSGAGVALSVIDTGVSAPLSIDPKGGSTLNLNINTTGPSVLGNASGLLTLNGSSYRFNYGSTLTDTLSRISKLFVANINSSTAATVRFGFTGFADTALTASTEAPSTYFNLGQTRQHSTGAVATQRDFRITGSTHSAVAASTLTNVGAFSVDGPDSAGTNATITNSSAIYLPTSVLTGTVTNGYGLVIAAPTGATNNYAASTTGRWVMSGLTTSAATQTAALCLNAANEIISDSVACVASSGRFKERINGLSTASSLAEVLKLKPVSFFYKPSFNGALQTNPNFNGEELGFIAEDVQKIDPRLVVVETATSTSPDGTITSVPGQPHTVRYEQLTAILAGAIQAQQAQIDALGGGIHQAKQGAEDNAQWLVIGFLGAWNLYLTFRRKKI